MAERLYNPYIHVRIHGRDALFNATAVADGMTRAEKFPEYVPTRWQRFKTWLVKL